jgi:hypothetical protein
MTDAHGSLRTADTRPLMFLMVSKISWNHAGPFLL